MIFLFLFLSSFLLVNNTESYSTCVSHCAATKCSDDSSASSSIIDNSPVIQFPFRIRSQRNYYSSGGPSAAGFEISCKQNKSFMHFESYGDLEVKSISYEKKILNLVDPNNCVHGVFLNLNLSDTPFMYYYVLKQYKYLNCSSPNSPLQPPFTRVPCLSRRGHHHVYIVESSLLSVVPDSCSVVKTVGIPFSYSPYISDNSFGLRFSWGSSDQKEKEEEQKRAQSDEANGSLTRRRRSWIDIIYYKGT